MKLVKGILIFIMTLFAVVIAFITYQSSASSTSLFVVVIVYTSLMYLVQPIGTTYSDRAYERLYIVSGIGMFLVSVGALQAEVCPKSPFDVFYPSHKIAILDLVTGVVCKHLGKLGTAIYFLGLGFLCLYLGYRQRIKLRCVDDI
jgi:hypothetical protein